MFLGEAIPVRCAVLLVLLTLEPVMPPLLAEAAAFVVLEVELGFFSIVGLLSPPPIPLPIPLAIPLPIPDAVLLLTVADGFTAV